MRPTHNSFALAKAWFPYDRPGRPSRLKKCSDDPDDRMETRLKGGVSLFSSRAAALVSRFSRALALPSVNVKKKKERLLAVYEKSVRFRRP